MPQEWAPLEASDTTVRLWSPVWGRQKHKTWTPRREFVAKKQRQRKDASR